MSKPARRLAHPSERPAPRLKLAPTFAPAARDGGPPMTPRQRQVLEHTAAGLTNPQIGEALHITERTVKAHLQMLFKAFHARGRAHLVALAYQRGVLPVDEGGSP